MSKRSGSTIALATLLPLLMLGLGGRAAMAHNNWALPLVGGLVGGYALNSVMRSHDENERNQGREEAQRYVPAAAPAPAPAPAAPPSASTTATGIEQKLNVLDDLAAKGYITQSEYKARRQALLNQL